MNFASLNPRQKKVMLAVLAGGALALFALLRRGGGGGGGSPSPDPGPSPSYGSAGTFADNGAQAAGLSTDVTGALGEVAVALEQLPDLVGTSTYAAVRDAIPPVTTAPPAPASGPEDYAAAFAPLLSAFTSAGAQNSTPVKQATSAVRTNAVPAPTAKQATAAAAPNVGFKETGARAGLNFKTVTKDGKVYRFFESKAGKADYGETKGSRIYIRAATK